MKDIAHRIQVLQEQHADLDHEVQTRFQEYADDLEVEELKKHKLRIRDEITALESQLESQRTDK